MTVDITPLFQNDGRWHTILVGDGPGTFGNVGCVVTALLEAARALGTVEPTVMPPNANQRFLDAGGCFVHWDEVTQHYVDGGDELVVPVAAPCLGLVAGDLVTGPGMADALSRVLADGGAAVVRVNTHNGDVGQHTITAVAASATPPGFMCLCPAVGRITLDANLCASTSWGKNDPRQYRAVNVRPIRRAPT